jgi:bifunctional non-homologous end joining protein LigD
MSVLRTVGRARSSRAFLPLPSSRRPAPGWIHEIKHDGFRIVARLAASAVRVRPGAPVSVPIDWKELSSLKSGTGFSLEGTLKRRSDPWKDIDKTAAAQRLPTSKAASGG